MKLSIIIPTYNEEKYLPKLLKSIEEQNFEDCEVIVADAASTDKTREIAESYGCKVVEGGSPAVGRNSGAKVACGEYLLFLDSDVILTEGYLQSALDEFIENEQGIGITQLIPLSDSKKDKLLHDFANLFMRSVESIKPHGAGCYGILTTKKLHDEVNGFDETYDFGEDSNYIERIGKVSLFRVLRKPRLLISTRRLQKEGLGTLARIYAKSTLYDFLGKRVTAGELNYNFGYEGTKRRILYSVCGEGMGHAIRSSVIINHLLEENEVIIFASDRAYDYLSQKFDNVYYIEGFNTVYVENSAKYRSTFIAGMRDLPKSLRNNMKILYSIARAFKPNIIISDFEAYSNLLSKILGIPLISVDNIHIITQTNLELPEKYYAERLAAKGVIASFISRPKRYLISTFFYPPVKNKNKVSLHPPVLRKRILNLKPYNGDHILVYQTSDSNSGLIDTLKSFDEKFVIYGFKMEKEDGNLIFREFNEKEFFKDFESCKAVIANGGFTLMSEAIYLGKPLFAIPVKKQFEQTVNSIYLQKLGYGEFQDELTRENFESFLSNIESYKKALSSFKHDKNQQIFKTLDKTIDEFSKKYKDDPQLDTLNLLEEGNKAK
ncbi:MJ1255/VC2487 family glycosyltransferase [Methanobacterium sp.]|uniref:MJ1255/VC2487 family glycosyltransferase n=1 Tax=Methanobacterium sp. TaxID=2164 RepID=UPI003C74487F